MNEPTTITTGALADGTVRLSIGGQVWGMTNETAVVLSRMLEGSAKRQTSGFVIVHLHQE